MTGTASRLEGLRVRAEPAAEQVLQEGVGRVTVILSTPEVPGTTHGPSEDTGAVPRRAVLRMESAHPGGTMPGTREPVAMLSPLPPPGHHGHAHSQLKADRYPCPPGADVRPL